MSVVFTATRDVYLETHGISVKHPLQLIIRPALAELKLDKYTYTSLLNYLARHGWLINLKWGRSLGCGLVTAKKARPRTGLNLGAKMSGMKTTEGINASYLTTDPEKFTYLTIVGE